MSKRQQESRRVVEFLTPETIILLIALLNFGWVLMRMVRELPNLSWREGDVHFMLFEQVLLLVAAFVLWLGKLPGHFIALLVAVLIFYEVGVLGYLGTAQAFGLRRFSYAAIRAFFGHWASHPEYALNVLLAFSITVCALFLLSRDVYRRIHFPNGGI